MKKTIGWILIILGGFFCLVSILCIPVTLFMGDATLAERIFFLIAFAGYAFVSRMICRLGFKLKGRETKGDRSLPQGCAQPSGMDKCDAEGGVSVVVQW